jgi:hypothetical protein
VQATTPTSRARTFAAFVGPLYARAAFDRLARRVNDLYDAEHATAFRAQLDRRLYDRYHDPVAWDLSSGPEDRAA